jgi:hypothetical protein
LTITERVFPLSPTGNGYPGKRSPPSKKKKTESEYNDYKDETDNETDNENSDNKQKINQINTINNENNIFISLNLFSDISTGFYLKQNIAPE